VKRSGTLGIVFNLIGKPALAGDRSLANFLSPAKAGLCIEGAQSPGLRPGLLMCRLPRRLVDSFDYESA
jgi:hypothetical protein